jgi:exoribonuclease R
VSCPSSCEYLQEARKHETPAKLDPAKVGNPDILVTEEFVESHAELMLALSRALTAEAETSGAVDRDVREALASLIQTYRTRQNGVIYEALPANPLAANLHRAAQQGAAEFRRRETHQRGISKTHDSDVLRVLVFFERLALDFDNRRPRGRAFLDMMRSLQPEAASNFGAGTSSLILP